MFQRDIDHNIQYFQHGISPLQCIIDTNFFKFIFLTINLFFLIVLYSNNHNMQCTWFVFSLNISKQWVYLQCVVTIYTKALAHEYIHIEWFFFSLPAKAVWLSCVLFFLKINALNITNFVKVMIN